MTPAGAAGLSVWRSGADAGDLSQPLRPHANKNCDIPGFYGWIRDWDVGGTYTDTRLCPDCDGGALRPEYLAVDLNGHNMHQTERNATVGAGSGARRLWRSRNDPHERSQRRVWIRSVKRLRFLGQVGLGYLHLNRISSTLSAGEAQRIKLAGLLGSSLTSLTVLLDEPSRGLHPSEVRALLQALIALRDEGNTVILVEHDLELIRAADFVCRSGPGRWREAGR